MPGTGINITPYASKYIASEEEAGRDKYWSSRTTYNDLLFAYGQHLRDYADISHLAKGLTYSKLGITESTEMSPLMDFITGEGGIEEIDKNYVRWRIYGEPDRRAMSFGNPNDDIELGVGGVSFKFLSDVEWFKMYDVIAPLANKRCNVVIISDEAIPTNGAYEYDAVLLDEDETAFLPSEYLDAGEYWLKIGSITSWERAGTPGSIQFGESFAYIEFEVPLTTMMWSFEIDGEAHRQFGNLEIARCDEEGRPLPEGTKITNYHEVRAMAQIDEEKELFLAYGSGSQHLIDENSGKQITTSPGLFEFMEEGNVIPYSPENNSIDFITDQMNALWFDRIATSQRRVLFYTGEAGLHQWSTWVNEKFGDTAAQFHYDFVLKKRTPFNGVNGQPGYAFARPQFVEYVLPIFGTIMVAHWKILDNTRINGITYPGSYYPVSSYEYLAFNIGFGEPNMKFLMRTDNKFETYQAGLWSPFGATGQDNPVFKNPAYQEESYRWFKKESFGLAVMDPSQLVWFKPNISY